MHWNLVLLALLVAPAAAQTPPGAVVQAEAQTQRLSCGGGDARIEGNHNTVVLTGPCRSLLLKGVANTVSIALQPGASVRVEGSENRISFQTTGAAPAVQILGPDNSVDPGAMPPAPKAETPSAPKPAQTVQAAAESAAPKPPVPKTPQPAPPESKPASGVFTLAGDDEQRDETCTGRPVIITGNRSAYVLRGGCLSVTVRGDLDTVQAELRPGAAVGIVGHGTTVSWVLLARGKAPASTVRGAGDRVQHINTIGGLPVR